MNNQQKAREILDNIELVLKITNMPPSLFFINLRIKQPHVWKLIREKLLKKHDKCVICGKKNDLHIHEEWSYDLNTGIAKIEELKPICELCHSIIHLNRSSHTILGRLNPAKDFFDDNEYWGYLEKQEKHWYKVNGFKKMKLDKYIEFELFNIHQTDANKIMRLLRDKKDWVVDWNGIKQYLR